MPRDTTPADIADAYLEGWRLGLKALAIYRDGSKESQPLSTSTESDKAAAKVTAGPRRERLPEHAASITHKFNVAGHEGYITVGLYDDGRPGELFITMAKEGSTIGGLMDCFGTAVSMSLQYGVPLEVYVNKFSHTRFEPMGHTKNPDIRIAKSIVDYIFRWLGITFLPGYREALKGMPADESPAAAKGDNEPTPQASGVRNQESPPKTSHIAGSVGGATASRAASAVKQIAPPKAPATKPTANGARVQQERTAMARSRELSKKMPPCCTARVRRCTSIRTVGRLRGKSSLPVSNWMPPVATTAARSPSATAIAICATIAAIRWDVRETQGLLEMDFRAGCPRATPP